MKVAILIIVILISSLSSLYSQITEQQYKAQFKENQKELDLEFGGIGLDFSRPNFGKQVVTDERWVGIDLISDIMHINYSVGTTKMGIEGFDKKQDTIAYYSKHSGQNISFGLNFPLPIGIGRQESYSRVLRLNPVVGFDVGAFNFWEGNNKIGFIGYASLSAGLRLRLPFCSLVAGWRFRAGVQSMDYADAYKSSGVDSYFTVRMDALKGLLNPNMVTFDARRGEIVRLESFTVTDSRYLGGGIYDVTSRTYT